MKFGAVGLRTVNVRGGGDQQAEGDSAGADQLHKTGIIGKRDGTVKAQCGGGICRYGGTGQGAQIYRKGTEHGLTLGKSQRGAGGVEHLAAVGFGHPPHKLAGGGAGGERQVAVVLDLGGGVDLVAVIKDGCFAFSGDGDGEQHREPQREQQSCEKSFHKDPRFREITFILSYFAQNCKGEEKCGEKA